MPGTVCEAAHAAEGAPGGVLAVIAARGDGFVDVGAVVGAVRGDGLAGALDGGFVDAGAVVGAVGLPFGTTFGCGITCRVERGEELSSGAVVGAVVGAGGLRGFAQPPPLSAAAAAAAVTSRATRCEVSGEDVPSVVLGIMAPAPCWSSVGLMSGTARRREATLLAPDTALVVHLLAGLEAGPARPPPPDTARSPPPSPNAPKRLPTAAPYRAGRVVAVAAAKAEEASCWAEEAEEASCWAEEAKEAAEAEAAEEAAEAAEAAVGARGAQSAPRGGRALLGDSFGAVLGGCGFARRRLPGFARGVGLGVAFAVLVAFAAASAAQHDAASDSVDFAVHAERCAERCPSGAGSRGGEFESGLASSGEEVGNSNVVLGEGRRVGRPPAR